MLHLFNKVYLEFDNNIELGFDRVVVSEKNGFKMLEALDKVSAGELIRYGKTWSETLSENSFKDFFLKLKDHQANTNRKIIIYCDVEAYKTLMAVWFRTTLPNLDLESFRKLTNYTVYNQRIVSNTQLASAYSLYLSQLWDGIGEVEEAWESSADLVSDQDRADIDTSGIKLSYEFLLADYFSGSIAYRQELLDTAYMFTERFFKECFTDNRQMVLLNIENHNILSQLGIDPSLVDITKIDPLENIEYFKYYSDPEIWQRSHNQYGICNLKGLSENQIEGLVNTLLYIYKNVEGMEIDTSMFEVAVSWAYYIPKGHLTQTELDGMLEYAVDKPFDTCLVPRFDFQNVNYPLIQHFISLKKNNNLEELEKFRLL
jgi:hypothetical protein